MRVIVEQTLQQPLAAFDRRILPTREKITPMVIRYTSRFLKRKPSFRRKKKAAKNRLRIHPEPYIVL